jgi:hypothetical protein
VADHACQFVQSAGGQRLLLAVDGRNEPALRVYALAGFHPWRRSAVYLKVIDAADRRR